MKRCPLCDFIYEDDQGICDMDGIELVRDGEMLSPAAKDSTDKPSVSAGVRRRRRSLHLLLGFGLGAAVFSAYYSSVNQAAPAGSGQGAAATSVALPAPANVEVPPAQPPATPPAETPAPPTEETTPAPTPTAPASEPRGAGAGAKRPRPGSGNRKKESKLASILNKTGRMLKKPFGF
jgi:hypothetical protein